MELNKLWLLILDTIDMSQAISVGIFLLIMNKRRKNSLVYLGFFLVVYGLGTLSDIFSSFNVFENNAFQNLLDFNFFWLIPVLLYLYTQQVAIPNPKRTSYYLLLPGGIDFFMNIGKFFLPLQAKTAFENSWFYITFTMIGFLFGIVIIFLIFGKIQKHSKLIKNQYSSVENRDLKWLNVAIVSIITLLFISGFLEFLATRFIADLFISLASLFITYWIAYNGLIQQVSVNLISEKQNIPITKGTQKSINLNDDKKDKQNLVIKKIINLLNQEKLFLNPDLTIVHIADKIGEHPRLVSGSINSICQENFNRFINKYRIEEAKQLLLNKKLEHLNMEGIGLEAGFNSNSSFYTAFKKELNITPLQFLKNSKS